MNRRKTDWGKGGVPRRKQHYNDRRGANRVNSSDQKEKSLNEKLAEGVVGGAFCALVAWALRKIVPPKD